MAASSAAAWRRSGASAASGRPSPAAGGHSSSIICCGTRPASDWRDSSVRQLSDSHRPMVWPQSRLSTGSHGFGRAEEQELRRAEPAAFGDPGVHAARIGLQHGAGLGGQGGIIRHGAPPQAERAHGPVERERRRTGEFRQPAGGGAAHQLHLEQPVARMHEARSPRPHRWHWRRGCAECHRRRTRYRPAPPGRGCGPAASAAAG